MENTNWKELWNKNYNCETEETQGLSEYVKGLNFGAKKGANYLPWGTAVRIFEQQGGTLEIVYTNGNLVEQLKIEKGCNYAVSNSEVTAQYQYCYSFFVNVKATWNGREYVEKYPIQDSSGKALQFIDQNDINKSIQRAKVKAIAVISGIGYKLYENMDLQFEQEEETVKAPKEVKQTKQEKKVVISEEPQEEQHNDFNRTKAIESIKQAFLQKAGFDSIVKNYLNEINKVKLTELTDSELQHLLSSI